MRIYSTQIGDHKTLILLSFLAFFSFWLADPAAAQLDASQISILSSDVSAYPSVRFLARVATRDGFAVQGLTGEHFSIGENYTSTPQAVPQSTPLNLVVVFDTTPIGIAEIQMYQQMAMKFGAMYQPGDNIWFMQSDSTPTAITSPESVQSFTRTMKFTNATDGNEVNLALQRAVVQLLPGQQANANVSIVFIASYTVNSPQFAYSSDIPLHVLQVYQTGTNRSRFTEKLRPLATGRFYALTQTESPDAAEFINSLNQSRTIYEVTYESRQAAAGMRSVPISVGNVSGTLQYEKDVFAPNVEILNSNFNIVRTQFNDKNDAQATGANFDKPSEDLLLRVSFPDGIDRNVNEATLYVDNIAQPASQINFDPINNEFELNWDVSSYTTTGTHSLYVEVRDEFGTVGRTPDTSFSITMNIVLPTVVVLDDKNVVKVGDTAVTPVAIFGGYAMMLASVVLLVGVIFWQRQHIASGLQKVGKSMIYGVEEIGRKTSIAFGRTTDFDTGGGTTNYNTSARHSTTNSMVGMKSDVVGKGRTEIEDVKPVTLGNKTDIEDSPDTRSANHRTGQELAVFNVTNDAGTGLREIVMRNPHLTFGRAREAGVDEVIRSSKISQLHCLIEYDHHEQAFYIKDEKTTNGTFIDGRQLLPNRRERLLPGTLIRLGQTFEMRFQPTSRMLQNQRPNSEEVSRRPLTTRADLMEGVPNSTPQTRDRATGPLRSEIPVSQNGHDWPLTQQGADDASLAEVPSRMPTNMILDQNKPDKTRAKPKTPPAKNGAHPKNDDWMD